jgi:hypothetical protein
MFFSFISLVVTLCAGLVLTHDDVAKNTAAITAQNPARALPPTVLLIQHTPFLVDLLILLIILQ